MCLAAWARFICARTVYNVTWSPGWVQTVQQSKCLDCPKKGQNNDTVYKAPYTQLNSGNNP